MWNLGKCKLIGPLNSIVRQGRQPKKESSQKEESGRRIESNRKEKSGLKDREQQERGKCTEG